MRKDVITFLSRYVASRPDRKTEPKRIYFRTFHVSKYKCHVLLQTSVPGHDEECDINICAFSGRFDQPKTVYKFCMSIWDVQTESNGRAKNGFRNMNVFGLLGFPITRQDDESTMHMFTLH